MIFLRLTSGCIAENASPSTEPSVDPCLRSFGCKMLIGDQAGNSLLQQENGKDQRPLSLWLETGGRTSTAEVMRLVACP